MCWWETSVPCAHTQRSTYTQAHTSAWQALWDSILGLYLGTSPINWLQKPLFHQSQWILAFAWCPAASTGEGPEHRLKARHVLWAMISLREARHPAVTTQATEASLLPSKGSPGKLPNHCPW